MMNAYARKLLCLPASYVASGKSVAFVYSHKLICNAGAYALTGHDSYASSLNLEIKKGLFDIISLTTKHTIDSLTPIYHGDSLTSIHDMNT